MQKRIEQRDHEYDQLEDMFQKQLLNPDVNNSMKLLQQLKMERGYIKEGFNKACDIAEAALQRVADLSNQVKYMKEGKSERLAAKQDSNETNEVGNFMKELKLVRGKEIQFNGKSSENLLAQFVKLIREGTAELPSGTKLVYKRTPKSNDNNEATVDTYLFK